MSGRFVDTHCHFDFPPFSDDEAQSIRRAADAGVARIIVPAIEAERFAGVVALTQRFEALYGTLGLHQIV
ncbi:TatD family hydrolase, partial [Leptospira borgpetersenii serovar Ballum]|nr:TatD family hydrolase [Leptospira borgpetersenii serovar Ballum]